MRKGRCGFSFERQVDAPDGELGECPGDQGAVRWGVEPAADSGRVRFHCGEDIVAMLLPAGRDAVTFPVRRSLLAEDGLTTLVGEVYDVERPPFLQEWEREHLA